MPQFDEDGQVIWQRSHSRRGVVRGVTAISLGPGGELHNIISDWLNPRTALDSQQFVEYEIGRPCWLVWRESP